MISTAKVWERVNLLAKTATAGYSTADDFNSDLYSVQWALISLLCDNYENNQKVSDALVNHVTILPTTTSPFGIVDAYSSSSDDDLNYYRTIAVSLLVAGNEYPARKININERAFYANSMIRGLSVASKKVGYSMGEGSMIMLPEEEMDIVWYYCRKPTEATIAFEVDDTDYEVVDEANTVDIEFPESLFNIFVYMMLERLGVEQKEQLSIEYAQLGIDTQLKTEIA